ncbi:hypothetical protein ABS772_15020 [Methylorubrum podarium]|uniref:Uncharacterized protein n=1 Tax=Methylorubrum podarium TaxID=200476 RepID=A0ABV1QPF5_9HYPH
MADASPTVGELFKAKAVTDSEVSAAVEAYLADPETHAHLIAQGYSVDLAAAVIGHAWAHHVVGLIESSQSLKRGAVRTAILLARARKA